MKKFLLLIFTCTNILLLVGCSTLDSSGSSQGELSRKDLKDLIKTSRDIIQKKVPDSKISNKNKEYVRTKKPNLSVSYNGYKKGRAVLKWNTGNKIIQYTARGDLTDAYESFQGINITKIKVKNNINN